MIVFSKQKVTHNDGTIYLFRAEPEVSTSLKAVMGSKALLVHGLRGRAI
jgi:hypothetical protein